MKQVYGKMSLETIEEMEKRAFDKKGKLIVAIADELGLSEEEMPFIMMSHFRDAASKIVPSVSKADRANYDELYAKHLDSRRKGK